MQVQASYHYSFVSGGYMRAPDLPAGHVSRSNHRRVRELYFYYYYYCHHLIIIIASIQAGRDWP